jgi:outer membrane receptor for ferrienterochelin and colicin
MPITDEMVERAVWSLPLITLILLAGCDRPVRVMVQCDNYQAVSAATAQMSGVDWFLTDASSDITAGRIERQRDQISKVRRWAETVADYCVRTAYIENLDLAERMTLRAEREMKTRSDPTYVDQRRKDKDKWDREYQERKALERTLPAPPK